MIIGVTGTNGAGKGTVIDYLTQKGFQHYSASGFITEEIERRRMPVNRDSMRLVANDLRRSHNPAYLFEPLYERASAEGGDAVLEAPRVIAEATFLKDRHVPLIAVDAERKVRYERISKRGSVKDDVSFEQFSAQEDRELNAAEAFDMNILGVMKLADFTLHNDGTLEELYTQIEEVLKRLRNNRPDERFSVQVV
jgi:dephospho-CoA kinase